MKLKKVVLEDYASQQVLYSKNLRRFDCEFSVEQAEDGKELLLIFDDDRIINDTTLLNEYIHTYSTEDGSVLRLTLNDVFFMLGLGKNITIDVLEYNYNKEKKKIIFKISSSRPVSNDKAIMEIQNYFKEEENGQQDGFNSR